MTHALLLPKFPALHIDENALILISDYLSERNKKVKISSVFSTYENIIQDASLWLLAVYFCLLKKSIL